VQHEIDKEREVAQYFYDVDLPQDVPVRDLLGAEVSGPDKVLLRRVSKQR
jgi:hypothetical protein